MPQLYKYAKQEKKPMTKYVNEILLKHLTEKVDDKPVSTPTTTESTTTEIKTLAS